MAKYAKDSAGADFLRSQALKRLPKDGAICAKAGEMLHSRSLNNCSFQGKIHPAISSQAKPPATGQQAERTMREMIPGVGGDMIAVAKKPEKK
jgi:hypothetical protein